MDPAKKTRAPVYKLLRFLKEVKRTNTIKRIPTGIPGLDEMMSGGLPFPSLTLVAGDIGSGKTTFCMQFLCKGAELNEPGLYFMTIGGSPEWIFKFISTYEFVDQKYFGNEIKYIDLGDSIEESKRARTFWTQFSLRSSGSSPDEL